jgi:hypothetical protein
MPCLAIGGCLAAIQCVALWIALLAGLIAFDSPAPLHQRAPGARRRTLKHARATASARC